MIGLLLFLIILAVFLCWCSIFLNKTTKITPTWLNVTNRIF